MDIGIAGTGRMGTAIGRRLLEVGHEVRVWNRTVANAHDAREAGARWAPTLGELVNDSEVVITFLFDNAKTHWTNFHLLLQSIPEGKLIWKPTPVLDRTLRPKIDD